VIEGRLKKEVKEGAVKLGTDAKLNFSNYPTKKKMADSGVGWGERRRK